VLFQTDYTIYTLPIFDRVRVRVRVMFNVQIKYSYPMIFKNSLSASWPVRELSSPRLDWPRVGLSASCPVSINTCDELCVSRCSRCERNMVSPTISPMMSTSWPNKWCVDWNNHHRCTSNDSGFGVSVNSSHGQLVTYDRVTSWPIPPHPELLPRVTSM